jgi:hypothetical protein
MRQYKPTFNVPHGFASAADYLEHLCRQALLLHETKAPDPDRPGHDSASLLDEEMAHVRKEGLADSILIAYDMVKWVRKDKFQLVMLRKPVRSFIAYLLRMTPINPMDFETFFSPDENGPCRLAGRFTFDFSGDGANRAREYLIEKYGRSHVAHLIGSCHTQKADPMNFVCQLHSCAFAISKAPLENVLYTDRGIPVFLGSSLRARKFGLLVFDLMSRSRILDEIQEKLRAVYYRCDNADLIFLDLRTPDLDDKETYRLMQLEEWAILNQYLYEADSPAFTGGKAPQCFKDLVSHLLDIRATRSPGSIEHCIWCAVLLFWHAYLQTWLEGERTDCGFKNSTGDTQQ